MDGDRERPGVPHPHRNLSALPQLSALTEPVTAVAALARSGLMGLTGWPEGPPQVPPWQLAARLAGLAEEIYAVTAGRGRPVRVSWEAAVAGRAALLGLRRQGQTSPNGSCRLLRTPDGWVALNLPRLTDAELIPALTGRPGPDAWRDAAALASVTPAAEFAARARLLGLAAATLPSPPAAGADPIDPCTTHPVGDPVAGRDGQPWRVIDLSSLWAGPLAVRVLAEAGAAVTKLESVSRPDGARATPNFYRWLHAPNETVTRVDLATVTGRQHAAALIEAADVVIEASRPRALEQLGLGPHERPGRPGRVWLSITGHGRDEPGRDWIAFGDDAAVAGGLVARDQRGDPVFCGDALADPLTGLTGALAVLRAREAGGGCLIDLAMSRAAASAARVAGDTAAGAAEAAGVAGDTAAANTATGNTAAGGPRHTTAGGPRHTAPGAARHTPARSGTSVESPVVEPDGAGGWRVGVEGRWEKVQESPARLDLILPVRD
jgi:crotonobetainyl-CoA:carnitine CoA-transferase CaiB-like acyl-CoA transferase